MGTLAFKSGLALGEMVRQGDIGAEELLEYYLGRVSRFNPDLNAVIQTIEEPARERARDLGFPSSSVWSNATKGCCGWRMPQTAV